MAKNYDTTPAKYAQLGTKFRNLIYRKLIKRESQSLLLVCAICLFVRLTQNNPYNQGWRQECSDTGAEFPDAGATPPPDFLEIWCS